MKVSHTLLAVLSLCVLVTMNARAQLVPVSNQDEETLEEAAMLFTLIEEFELAADAYDFLLEDKPDDIVLLNSAGTNHLLSALDRFIGNEMRYYLPVEVSVRDRVRGTRSSPYTDEELKYIKSQLLLAKRRLDRVIRLKSDWSTGYLNLATCEMLLTILENGSEYSQAFEWAVIARDLAMNHRSKANSLMIMAILYELVEDLEERNRIIFEIEKLLADNATYFSSNEIVRFKNNIKMSKGDYNIVSTNLKSPEVVYPGLKEQIGGISLKDSFEELLPSSYFENYNSDESDIPKIGKRVLPHSYIIIFDKGESQYLLQKTVSGYPDVSARQIEIGSRQEEIWGNAEENKKKNKSTVKYGKPWKEVPISDGGKYLVYKHAKIIFRIDSEDRVEGWMIWAYRRTKKK